MVVVNHNNRPKRDKTWGFKKRAERLPSGINAGFSGRGRRLPSGVNAGFEWLQAG